VTSPDKHPMRGCNMLLRQPTRVMWKDILEELKNIPWDTSQAGIWILDTEVRAPAMLQIIIESQNRIIECFGLEGSFRGHLSQPPCSEQGYLLLDQVTQSPVQPGLECFQGWGLHCHSGQPVPVFHHPHSKKFLPYIQSKSTLP